MADGVGEDDMTGRERERGGAVYKLMTRERKVDEGGESGGRHVRRPCESINPPLDQRPFYAASFPSDLTAPSPFRSGSAI